jgi:hypothetical protein
MKPDTIDQDTSVYIQKPDTIDIPPSYNKPNTYDDQDYSTSLPQEVIDDLIVRAEFINGKRPDVKTNEEEEEESVGRRLTSSILSQTPSFTTSLSTPPPTTATVTVSPSASSVSSTTSSNISSATSRMALLQILKKKPMEDMLSYDLRKHSLSRPHEHDLYFKGTKTAAYKKIQPHSYSWGFQNVLYRLSLQSSSNEKIKVAEARRRAFKKEITIEWGDFPTVLNEKEYNEQEEEEQDSDSIITAGTQNTTKSNQLHNRTKSHLLFTYDTEFEGYRIRWKRASLLSHDMICEIKPDKHLEEGDAPKRKWRVIAEFDSHRMGYFIHLGELIIDKNALNLVERPDHLEAHIIVTCSTLIDLMREVVEKAVGLNKGGVVGSD